MVIAAFVYGGEGSDESADMNGIQLNAVRCAVLKLSRTTLPAKILLQQSETALLVQEVR